MTTNLKCCATLLSAVERNHPPCVKILLSEGVEYQILFTFNDADDVSYIDYAESLGFDEIAKIISDHQELPS